MSQEGLRELGAVLERELDGEIRLDAASRRLYSTDASIYQIEPLGVVIPKHEDDLAATVSLAAEYSVPIVPRGSGSGLAGQSLGPALVIDCSRYLNQIVEIDPKERAAWVQPGVVLNEFNYAAARYGLKYGPDPASADRATFGGMLGNNSTGAHSILYGMTSDNVLAVDVLLADGSPARLESLSLGEAAQRAEQEGREGALYRASLDIRGHLGDEINARWPRTWRRASGYALNYLLNWSASAPPRWEETGLGPHYPPGSEDHLNLAPLMVGSEGGLGIFRRAKIHLVPTPQHTALGVLAFESIEAACEATPGLLALNPSAIELIPRALIERARSVPAYAARLGFVPGDPAAILVVEFSGDESASLVRQVRALGPEVVVAETDVEQSEVWAVRKVGLGLLMSIPGDTKPLPFVEDMAVPVERLGDFVRGFERILAQNDTTGDFYAHASAGCLHVRPLLNLKTARGIERMRGISKAVVDLTLGLGGALSGEHGDGLSHAEWIERGYGPELVAAFQQLKLAADPDNRLNPGKIIDPPRMDENLRYGTEYQIEAWLPVLNYDRQAGLAGAIEMCNGAGVCRKDGGVMCPSFQATREEMHSTRGRANLLRALISGGMPGKGDAEEAVHQALDLCLECKGCKAECPSGVDVAKLKYEFLNHYYEDRRRPLRDYLFAHIGSLGRLGRATAPIANLFTQTSLGKTAGEALLGLSAERGLPAFQRANGERSPSRARPDVLYLPDAFTEFFYPDVKTAALGVLATAGLQVTQLPVVGAGRTMISKGFLSQAKQRAEEVLAAVRALDPEGELPVVGLEPSEIYTLRDEYLDLLPGDPEAAKLAERAYMFEEFLLRPFEGGVALLDRINEKLAGKLKDPRALLHGHCYQKAQPPAADGHPTGVEASATLLRNLGWQVDVVDSGCCGMAGSFGYEAEHYELSMQIGEMALFPAVRGANEEQTVVAAGVSCRTQIASGTGRQALHPAVLISQHLA